MNLCIVRTKKYVKSFKKIWRSGKVNVEKINTIIDQIACGETLPEKCRDHQLCGDMKNFRECHIQPDLLLIYQIIKQDLILVLVDIGSHSEIF